MVTIAAIVRILQDAYKKHAVQCKLCTPYK